ncbi:hypothetical protein [Alicyclobacillus macrosporangiidus]|nr:hypothetical protein [Alicyclobacillus macrosporangiidus]
MEDTDITGRIGKLEECQSKAESVHFLLVHLGISAPFTGAT